MDTKKATDMQFSDGFFPHIKNLSEFRKLHQQQRNLYLDAKLKEKRDNNEYAKKRSDLGIPNVSLPNLIGPRIKWLREHRKLSQSALASRAGVSRSTVIRCENDGLVPNMEHLERMVAALCDPKIFIAYSDDFLEWQSQFAMEELPKRVYSILELEELKKKLQEHFDETTLCHTQKGMTAYLKDHEKELLLNQLYATIDLTAQIISDYPRPRHRKISPPK